MDNRYFNSIMHINNENWAANVLKMQVNPSNGPDLIDKEKVVECKFKLIHPDRYNHMCWPVLDYQLKYDQLGKEAYWAVGTYTLSKLVSKIETYSTKRLEKLVKERTITLVEWDWMKQFPIYSQSGKTKLSEWNNKLIYPKGRLIPPITQEYKVDGGKVYLTKGINPKKFDIAARLDNQL